ncbi:glycosyltransferase [bacterium]|nr:glycosyltransferase [bacterium]
MEFVVAVLLLPVLIYTGVLLVFQAGLQKKDNPRSQNCPRISVVIAARNEEKNIRNLLDDLKIQTYSEDLMEILIADDHSEDGTAEIVRAYSRKDSRFRLISIKSAESGFTAKKNALAQALHHATGEIILTTDADCRVLPGWAETMVSYFTKDTGMVVGFSQLCIPNTGCIYFQKLQAVDFLMLMAAALGTARLGWAWAASGQNLAYRKSVYHEVGGFTQIGRRISGDDVLLLQLIRKKTDWKIRFASSENAYNHTQAESTFSAFINQRKRWASNGAYQWKLNKPFFGYVIITFLTNLILCLSLPLALILPNLLCCLLIAWGLKLLAEAWLLIRGCRLFGRTDLLSVFPVWFFVQIPYVVYVGIFGTLGGFHWKNRIHLSSEQK